MSLLLLALLACATDEDSAGFDSASPEVATVEMSALTATQYPASAANNAAEAAARVAPAPAELPAAIPAVATPAIATAAIATPAEAPVAASCPIPVFAPPEPAPEVRLADWVTRQGGLIGGGRHRMEAGETAWGIATQLGVSVWVLRAMNPTLDLDHLMVGDWIDFPVTQHNEKSAWQLYTEEECGC